MRSTWQSAVTGSTSVSLGLIASIGWAATPALAGAPAETVKTPTGLALTVTPTAGLDPAGATVTVTGRGYDRTV
ncbi:MAG: hypothetical protein F2697_05050, partial [Actinobacteria bacterium]|nr:hypothetical protein [Actinomycetota bacterium]